MSDSFLSQLVDFGALGLFAAYLAVQHFRTEKRLDRLITDFQQELKSISDAFDARANTIRDRYEQVISNLRVESRSERDKIADQRDSLHKELLDRERQSVMNWKLRDDK
jgi:ElaB/YqjD/DUF883 family membrane-anchored ribosome-binding protein